MIIAEREIPQRSQDEQEEKNTYAHSTATVLDKATIPAAFLWNIEGHVGLANRTGLDGIELWPHKTYIWEIKDGYLSPMTTSKILSTHQSPGKSFRDARSIKDLQVALFLPNSVDSIDDLGIIRNKVGDIPVVLFENLPQEKVKKMNFTSKGIQVSAEVCEDWSIDNPHDFLTEMRKRGFTNPVIDTHHIRRSHIRTGEPNPLANWKESIPVLLPHTKEIHLGIGREDYGDMDKKQIVEEAIDLLSDGNNDTEVIQMLRLIKELGWKGLVVLEMRPSVIKRLRGDRFFLATKNLEIAYEKIRETLYKIFKD